MLGRYCCWLGRQESDLEPKNTGLLYKVGASKEMGPQPYHSKELKCANNQ